MWCDITYGKKAKKQNKTKKRVPLINTTEMVTQAQPPDEIRKGQKQFLHTIIIINAAVLPELKQTIYGQK